MVLDQQVNKRRTAMKTLQSKYYLINTPEGPLHIHIDYDKSGIKKIFTNIPPVGTDWSNTISFMGILLSEYFKLGGSPEKICIHLNIVKGPKRVFLDNGIKIESVPQAIEFVIREFYNEFKKEAERNATK